MQIKQYKDGSAKIVFSEEEKKIILDKGCLTFTAEGLRHFGNNLVKIVSEFQLYFDEKTKQMYTESNDIETT